MLYVLEMIMLVLALTMLNNLMMKDGLCPADEDYCRWKIYLTISILVIKTQLPGHSFKV
jgi:hypothetical protein